ncbi:hypothetical protein NNA36_16045 [Shimia sp. CNT1-13L.2]|uniref:hypothetical protein n=1 Tax=Shimia sp. CNT1-13L.2 TaxID=2959663 RepID=UPI0020CF6CA9|nr:hypothetical protein [Shimia sp. CNT1-13L.2]MCP9483474.1 hypothetical protein [Shimia sp. CNT1-13L.2]
MKNRFVCDATLPDGTPLPCFLFLGHDGVDWMEFRSSILEAFSVRVVPVSFGSVFGISSCLDYTRRGSLLADHAKLQETSVDSSLPWYGAANIQPELFREGLQKALIRNLYSAGKPGATCVFRSARTMLWDRTKSCEDVSFLLDSVPGLQIVTLFNSSEAAVDRFVAANSWRREDSHNTILSTESCFEAFMDVAGGRVIAFSQAEPDDSLAKLSDKINTIGSET